MGESSITERTRKIVQGALQDSITQHGPITRENLTSAVKRVVAQLRSVSEGTVMTGDVSADATIVAWKKRYDKLRHGHLRLIDRYERAQAEIKRLRMLCEVNGIVHTTLEQVLEQLEEEDVDA